MFQNVSSEIHRPYTFYAAQLEAKSKPFPVVPVFITTITYISKGIYTIYIIMNYKISKYDEVRARLSVGMLR